MEGQTEGQIGKWNYPESPSRGRHHYQQWKCLVSICHCQRLDQCWRGLKAEDQKVQAGCQDPGWSLITLFHGWHGFHRYQRMAESPETYCSVAIHCFGKAVLGGWTIQCIVSIRS